MGHDTLGDARGAQRRYITVVDTSGLMRWREEGSSQRTLRWREMDSNHRSPARKSRFLLRKANCGTERGQPKRVVSYAVPMVRIHLPPAESPSLFRSCFRGSRTPLSVRLCAAGL